MSDPLAEARTAAPFPLEPIASARLAPADDPLAGDWSEGLRGPVRALGIPQPRLLTAGAGASAPAPAPSEAPPVSDGSVEAPDAWAVADDPLHQAEAVVELNADAALEEPAPESQGEALHASSEGLEPPASLAAEGAPQAEQPEAQAEEVIELPAELALEAHDEHQDAAEEPAAPELAPEPVGALAEAAPAAEAPVASEPAAAQAAATEVAATPPDSAAASPVALPAPGPAARAVTDSAAAGDDASAWTRALLASAPVPAGETPWSEPVASAPPAPAPAPWLAAPVAELAAQDAALAHEVSLWSASTVISPASAARTAPVAAADAGQSWAPEAPRADVQEIKVAADPAWAAAAPDADWSAVSAGPDWNAAAPAPAAAWTAPAAADAAWQAPAAEQPAAAAESRWAIAPPVVASAAWEAPAPVPLPPPAAPAAEDDLGDALIVEDPDLLVPVDEPAAPPAAERLAHVSTVSVGALFVEGEHRVAVHLRGGGTRRGVVRDIDLARSQFALQPQGGGAPETVHHADVKAIFFMLGSGEKLRPADGPRVRVTFPDGRSIEGNRDGGAGGPHGFFFVPMDAARTNTRRIYVAREALSDVRDV